MNLKRPQVVTILVAILAVVLLLMLPRTAEVKRDSAEKVSEVEKTARNTAKLSITKCARQNDAAQLSSLEKDIRRSNRLTLLDKDRIDWIHLSRFLGKSRRSAIARSRPAILKLRSSNHFRINRVISSRAINITWPFKTSPDD